MLSVRPVAAAGAAACATPPPGITRIMVAANAARTADVRSVMALSPPVNSDDFGVEAGASRRCTDIERVAGLGVRQIECLAERRVAAVFRAGRIGPPRAAAVGTVGEDAVCLAV